MPTNAPPAAPWSAAKMAVLEAAASVIRDKGPRGATLKSIARRAGITEPAIFRHFAGIDGLFEALFVEYERMGESLVAACPESPADFETVIGAMADCVDLVADRPDFAYLFIHADLIFSAWPELRLRRAGMAGRLRSSLEGALDAAFGPEGRGFAAALIRGLVYCLIVDWLDSGEDFDIGEACAARLSGLRAALARS